MQFQVPQNIDLEDKIIGPLTLIQFIYVLAGAVAVYLLYLSFGTELIFWVLGIPTGLIALAFAFFKVQDQPLSHFIKAGLIYLGRPKKRVWQKRFCNSNRRWKRLASCTRQKAAGTR